VEHFFSGGRSGWSVVDRDGQIRKEISDWQFAMTKEGRRPPADVSAMRPDLGWLLVRNVQSVTDMQSAIVSVDGSRFSKRRVLRCRNIE
jgi:hypothetical protein